MSTKWCPRCRRFRALDEFGINKYMQSGRQSTCRECATNYVRRLRGTRGLAPGLVDAILAEQDGLCAICHGDGGARGLFLDHDHSTGSVRGLLCVRCNSAIGYLDDDPDRARALIEYLARPARVITTSMYAYRPPGMRSRTRVLEGQASLL